MNCQVTPPRGYQKTMPETMTFARGKAPSPCSLPDYRERVRSDVVFAEDRIELGVIAGTMEKTGGGGKSGSLAEEVSREDEKCSRCAADRGPKQLCGASA